MNHDTPITSLYIYLKLISLIFFSRIFPSPSLSLDRHDTKTYLNEESPRGAEIQITIALKWANFIVNIGAK